MASGLEELTRGAAEVIGGERLEQQLAQGKSLKVKVGFDPTAPDLHLGHTVVMTAMRRFQDQGHEVVFLLGDFTALIGDPSGRDSTRPGLSREQIAENAATYTAQVGRLLDMERLLVRRNSKWLGSLGGEDFIRLASSITLARMLERDDFSRRFGRGQSIALHEFIYPLMQAYDSLVLETEVEMGGTDQIFNMLLGRELQRRNDCPQQAVITWPLLEGTDGVRKMSKSLGNYIALGDSPEEMFGKLMSISDSLMWRYYELLSLRSSADIRTLKAGHPRDAKMELGMEVVARYHDAAAAGRAREDFIARFSRGETPSDDRIPRIQLDCDDEGLAICNAMERSGMAKSVSEAGRLVMQNAVRLDGERISDRNLALKAGSDYLLQVGKRRIARLKLISQKDS